MKFNDSAVAAKYKAPALSKNQVVHVPAGKSGDGWKGKLADIPLASADKLFAQGSNMLELKEKEQPSVPSAPPDSPNDAVQD